MRRTIKLMHASPPPIQIRAAQLSDAAVIAEFNLCIAAETEDRDLDASRLRKGVEALLGDPSKGIYFLAEIDSAAAGCRRLGRMDGHRR